MSPKRKGKSHDPYPVADMLSGLKHKFGVAPGISPPASAMLSASAFGMDPSTGLQEDLYPWQLQSPMALQGKTKDPDLPSTREALSGPKAEEFWNSMDKEIASLELKDAWEVVDRSSIPAGMKAVPGTWAHRIK